MFFHLQSVMPIQWVHSWINLMWISLIILPYRTLLRGSIIALLFLLFYPGDHLTGNDMTKRPRKPRRTCLGRQSRQLLREEEARWLLHSTLNQSSKVNSWLRKATRSFWMDSSWILFVFLRLLGISDRSVHQVPTRSSSIDRNNYWLLVAHSIIEIDGCCWTPPADCGSHLTSRRRPLEMKYFLQELWNLFWFFAELSFYGLRIGIAWLLAN